MALAHHILTIVYHILPHRIEYVELGGDDYDQRNKAKTVDRLVKRLSGLGYQVTLQSIDPPLIPSTPQDSALAPPPPPNRKRGPPCKCSERGIICTHGTVAGHNSLLIQPSAPEEFS
jgi:hypothetical protein